MAGTMTERQAGAWRLRATVGYKPGGAPVQRTRTFHGTKKEAAKELAKFVTEVEAGNIPLAKSMTVREFVIQHWLPQVQANLESQTYKSYRERCNRFLPLIGDSQLDKLTTADLDKAYALWSRNGLSPSTIRNTHVAISLVLNQAIKWDLLTRNVATKTTRPQRHRRATTLPTFEQVRELVATSLETDPVLSATIMVAAMVGLRRGELLGLRWGDIDRQRGALWVTRSIKQVRTVDGGVFVGTLKTDNQHWVSIDAATVAVFDIHRDRIESRTGVRMTDDCYVLTWDPSGRTPGGPISLGHKWSKLFKKLGVTCRLHDLRHLVATVLLSQGVDIATVAKQLGNTPGVVTATYAHALQPAQRQAAGIMPAMLMPATPDSSPGPAALS